MSPQYLEECQVHSRCLINVDSHEYMTHEEYMHNRYLLIYSERHPSSFDYTICLISACSSEAVKWNVGWSKYSCINADDLINTKLACYSFCPCLCYRHYNKNLFLHFKSFLIFNNVAMTLYKQNIYSKYTYYHCYL